MSPDIWVAVPASRPSMVWRVLGNFRAQEYGRKRLLVVENGDAVGEYAHFDQVDQVLRSEPHQSAAKNTAIAWLKKHHPDSYVAFMDDDDYYSPHYLTEHAERAAPGRINGKRNGWVKFNTRLVFFGQHWKEHAESLTLVGGTMGFFVEDAVDFPMVAAGEERGFCDEARRLGKVPMTMSHKHVCYSREGSPAEHAYRAAEEKVWRHSGVTGVVVDGSWEDWVDRDPPTGPAVHHNY